MTPERFEEVARFVVQVAREDPTGEDLVTLVLAAMYMLPENVRLRELRANSSQPRYGHTWRRDGAVSVGRETSTLT